MTRKQLKDTPIWLRIVRKLYAHLGATALGSIWAFAHLTSEQVTFAMAMYAVGLYAIQLICDTCFKKDIDY